MDTLELGNVPALGDWLNIAPLRKRSVVLIHIDDEGTITQAHSVNEKQDLLCELDGIMLVGWTGKWRTDIRCAATLEELDSLAMELA